jgi:hypothetical protein
MTLVPSSNAQGAVMQTMIEHGIDTALMIGAALVITAALMVNAALVVGIALAAVRSMLARAAAPVVAGGVAGTWHDSGAEDDDPDAVPRPDTMGPFRAHPAALSGSEGAR